MHDVEALRGPPGRQQVLAEARSASQASTSLQSVIFRLRLSCSLSLRIGPSRDARSETLANTAASDRSAPLALWVVVQHGWPSTVIFEPHSRPFEGVAVRSWVMSFWA